MTLANRLIASPHASVLARITLALSIALAVPQMIVTLAPPAPGDTGFLVWF